MDPDLLLEDRWASEPLSFQSLIKKTQTQAEELSSVVGDMPGPAR